MNFAADNMCFACGKGNLDGLQLTFTYDSDAYITTFVADRKFQGYEGIIHGGILATVLDEVMARYVWEKAGPAATAKLEVRYKRPAPTGQPITVSGWITGERRQGRVFHTSARACLADGTVLAEATGIIMKI